MNLVKNNILQLQKLPRSWADPKWHTIRDKYGLTNVELTELQAEVELQKEHESLQLVLYQNLESCLDGALTLLKVKGFSVERLPKNTSDRRWHQIQRELDLPEIYTAVLLYHAAVQEDILMKEKKEEHIKNGSMIDKCINPTEERGRSVPNLIHRRHSEKALQFT